MKKILLIVIVIVLLSGSVLRGRKGKVKREVREEGKVGQESGRVDEEEKKEKKDEKGERLEGTLKEMMKLGVSLKCSWEEGENSGISYIDDESIYVEIVIKEKKEYMIGKGDCMWIWSSEDKEGVKMCFEDEEERDEVSEIDWEMEYRCVEEKISSDRFDLPDEVEFEDMDDVLETFLPE